MELLLLDAFVYGRALFKVLLQTVLLWIHTRIPARREEIKKVMYAPYRRLEIQGLDEDQQLESFFTVACVLERTKLMYICDRGATVKLGGEAYNSTIHHMDGSKGRLLDFQKPGRPLVLNFGSCT